MLRKLWNDEVGAILSAEVVLIGTILVIGMVVGLVELQCAVAGELNDLGEAIGSLNQSYLISGFATLKADGTPKAQTAGSAFTDQVDDCDGNQCGLICNAAPTPEVPKP